MAVRSAGTYGSFEDGADCTGQTSHTADGIVPSRHVRLVLGQVATFAENLPTSPALREVILARVYRAHVGKDGAQRWGVDYVDPKTGNRIRRVVGNKKQAELELARTLTDIGEGSYGRVIARRKFTVSDLRDAWLDDRAFKRTISKDRFRWLALVEHFGADRPIRSITPADATRFRGFVAGLRHRYTGGPLSLGSIYMYIALAKSAFALAVDRQLIAVNPFAAVKLPKLNNARDRVASESEFNRIVARCPSVVRVIAFVAVETGMRLGEIVSLTTEQIDFAERVIKLRRTKSDRGRIVPLTHEVCSVLRDWVDGSDGRVFRVSQGHVSMSFMRAARSVGIQNIRFHDLRATWATRRLREGVSTLVVKQVLGHQNFSMVERYARLVPDDLHAALDNARARSKASTLPSVDLATGPSKKNASANKHVKSVIEISLGGTSPKRT